MEGHWRHGGVAFRDNLVKIVVDVPDIASFASEVVLGQTGITHNAALSAGFQVLVAMDGYHRPPPVAAWR